MASDPVARIVIADDDPDILRFLERQLAGWGHTVATARTKGELMASLARHKPALLLLDLRFGETCGLELLRQLLDSAPGLTIVMLTAHGSIDAAVSAIRQGAVDFLTKPPDPERLRAVISQALAARPGKAEAKPDTPAPGLKMLGESPALLQATALLRNVAPTDATVLLLGESGTGKELAARTIHDLSGRAAGPFVPLNMASLPRELAESQLFGHEKGAFTGADKAQAGACEQAHNGTLFLDEIGELEMSHQAKLLRFLQERTVQRVGNSKAVAVNVRVVAATNRDLRERVRAGFFREDLFFRLNVVPIELPSLRQRREDIRPLAEQFLARAAAKYRKGNLWFTPAALERFESYEWPGNIRQLENLIERLAILCPGPAIGPEAFLQEFQTTTFSAAPRPTAAKIVLETGDDVESKLVNQIEKQAIIGALAESSGNVSAASHQLGLSQATVYRKLKRYRIDLANFA